MRKNIKNRKKSNSLVSDILKGIISSAIYDIVKCKLPAICGLMILLVHSASNSIIASLNMPTTNNLESSPDRGLRDPIPAEVLDEIFGDTTIE